MQKKIKSLVLLTLFLSLSINGMNFVPALSVDGPKSFFKENPVLALFLCGATSFGLYRLYHRLCYRDTSKIQEYYDLIIVPTEQGQEGPSVNEQPPGDPVVTTDVQALVVAQVEKKTMLFPLIPDNVVDRISNCFQTEKNRELSKARALWEHMRKDYEIYYLLFQSSNNNATYLPIEINRRIASFMMRLNNPHFSGIAEQQLAQRLLSCSIYLRDDIKKLKLSSGGEWTSDKKYYVTSKCIYDAATKEIIKQFDCESEFTLFKKKNMVLLHARHKNDDHIVSLYDIENDKKHVLMTSRTHCRDHVKIPVNEDYLVGYDREKVILWNIINFDEIDKNKIIAPYVCAWDVALSLDDKFLAAVSCEDGIPTTLWKIDSGELKEVATYQGGNYCYVRFMGNNLMLTHFQRRSQPYCLNLEITEYSNGEMSMKEVFNLQQCAAYWDHQSSSNYISNEVFIYADNSNNSKKLVISTFSGSILHKEDGHLFRPTLSADRQHLSAVFYPDEKNILLHFLPGPDDNIFVSKQTINHNPGACTTINQQSSLVLQDGYDTKGNGMLCLYDINGNFIKSWNPRERSGVNGKFSFHSNGRAVLHKDVKSTLYPRGADDHCKKIVENMTVAQYYALEKICSVVKQRMDKSEALLR